MICVDDEKKFEETEAKKPKKIETSQDSYETRGGAKAPGQKAVAGADRQDPVEAAKWEHAAAATKYAKLSVYRSAASTRNDIYNSLTLDRGISRLERDFRSSQETVKRAGEKLKALTGQAPEMPKQQSLPKANSAGQFLAEFKEPDLKRSLDYTKSFVGTAGKVLKPLEKVADAAAKIVSIVPRIQDWMTDRRELTKVIANMVKDGYLPPAALTRHMMSL
jgi:hypothetical protein